MVENLENEAKHKEESNGLIHYFHRVAFFFLYSKILSAEMLAGFLKKKRKREKIALLF